MAAAFSTRLLKWFDKHGRHDLPWQHPRSAYRVWVSEVMLQQTQVATVIPYFRRFMRRFPTLGALARARPDTVLAHWSGLGYYARARNLHKAAKQIAAEHGGRFPRDFESVAALPGVGRSTAGAILAQAFGQRHPILEGNARRVFARHAGIAGWPGEPRVAGKLWAVAEARLPDKRMADYTQALMDLGATLCTARNPRCDDCPVRGDCEGFASGRVHLLPGTRPKRERPHRYAALLLVRNSAGALLFERRPPAGIWGGLWCPPVVEGNWEEAARNLGARANGGDALPDIDHAFSHYDLTLQPRQLLASRRAAVSEPGDRAWLTLPQAMKLGLPAPVRTLLEAMNSPLPLEEVGAKRRVRA